MWLTIKKRLNQKMCRRPRQTFLQRHTDGQEAREKMLNTVDYQRNANQNYNELSPLTPVRMAGLTPDHNAI